MELLVQVFYGELVGTFSARTCRRNIGLNCIDEFLHIRPFVDTVIVERVSKSFELSVAIPIAKSKWGNVQKFCSILDCDELR
jgi:hypothetical protein